jgi:hypothetical protein
MTPVECRLSDTLDCIEDVDWTESHMNEVEAQT